MVRTPLVLSLLVIAVYSNAFTGSFVFDDVHAIVNNESIRSVWPLSKSWWPARDLPTSGRPLVNVSFALNYAVGQLNPFGYHLVNVVLHCFNATWLFALVHRTLTMTTWGRSQPSTAWLATVAIAALWALHPMQTESVSYVTQRSELWMAFFLLATLYTAQRAYDAPNRSAINFWQAASLSCCGLGMLCKEVMVVAPLLVVLYDLTMHDARASSIVRRRFVFHLGLFATWGILAALLATNPRKSSVGFGLSIDAVDYLTTQFWAIGHYLLLSIWPAWLCADYGIVVITDPVVWLPRLLLLGGLFAGTVVAWFRWPRIAFLGLWFFAILAPTSSFIPIISEPVAERRMYLPILSVIVLMVSGLLAIAKRLSTNADDMSNELPRFQERLFACFVLAMCLLYGGATYARNRVFQSELAFWTDAIEKRPANQRAFCNLGVAYQNAGERLRAIESFQKAIAIAPAYTDARYNLAICYCEQGQLPEAIEQLDEASRLSPTSVDIQCALGVCLARLGQLGAAMDRYSRAIELGATVPEPYSNRGHIYVSQGRFTEAIEDYRRAIELAPDRPQPYFGLGNAFYALKRTEEAIEAYLKCVAIQPDQAEAWKNLGNVYSERKQPVEAKKCFQQLLRLHPASIEAQTALQQLP